MVRSIHQHRKRRIWLLALVLLSETACAPVRWQPFSNIEALAKLPRGIPLTEVRKRLNISGDHLFLVEHAGDPYLCVRFYYSKFEKGTQREGPFYCVFKNDKLLKVAPLVTDEPRRTVSTLSGTDYGEPWLRNRKAGDFLAKDDSTAQQLIDSTNSTIQHNCWGWAPVVILAWPVILIGQACESTAEHQLAARFDAQKIKIGMTVEEVDRLLGPPWDSRPSTFEQIRYYGDGYNSPPSTYKNSFTWIAVYFSQAKVVGVFSDPFFEEYRYGPF